MEAVGVGRSGVSFVVAQTRSLQLSAPTPVDAKFPTHARGLPVGGISSSRNRLLCRALPVVRPPSRSSHEVASPRGREGGGICSLAKTVADAVFEFLQYTPLEEKDAYISGNFAPVDEVGDKVPVKVIAGAIPRDFPVGTYIRTGPNPLFGGKCYKSKLGITKHHWFEGDGMLHAVYFEKNGDEHQVFYRNKYVETKGYMIEKEKGKPIILSTVEGAPIPLVINILLNQLRFGFHSKPTCNTSIWCHGGRVFAASEQNLPYEINLSDLTTMGEFNCKGAWPLDNITAHPKVDPITNELIFQGLSSTKKPYSIVGVLSGDGQTLVHTVDMGFERQGLNHDIAITARYTVVMDFPILIDPALLVRGKPIIRFDPNSYTRFGILPRFGDTSSIRWFQVETNAMFHIFNAYDNGHEVVLHGLRTKTSFLNLDMNLDQEDWFRRGMTVGVSDQEGYDPLVDGALLTYIHEWRFNLETGTVTERDIDDEQNYAALEFPRINDSYVGRKYKYGYAACIDLDRARKIGLPCFGDMISKVDFSSSESGKGAVKTEFHELGPNRHGGEVVFVAKPGSTEEDDGWILLYVYDGNTDQSEAIIVDAQKFTEGPVARILLPQRVPFGFHGTYIPAG